MPAEGVPDVVVDERRLVEAARAIAAGRGPVAVDAERASGYRYGQRAYLVQLRREGSGTWLIDPIACPDLAPVAEAIGDAEWVLHAATPGPALPRRGGPAPDAAVRHRARRHGWSACRASASPPSSSTTSGSAWPRSTRPSTGPPGRCPSRGCATPRSTSRCSSSCATLLAADLAEQGKTAWAREEFDAARPVPGPAGQGRAVAPHLRHPPHPRPPRRGPGPRAVAGPRHASRRSVTSPPAGSSPTPADRRGRQGPRQPGRAGRRCPAFPGDPALPAPAGWPRSAAPSPCPTPSCRCSRSAPTVRRRRTGLGRPRPGRRRPAGAARAALADLAAGPPGAGREPPLARTRCGGVLWTPPEPADVGRGRRGAARLGARPWQVDLVAPVIAAAVVAHPDDEG